MEMHAASRVIRSVVYLAVTDSFGKQATFYLMLWAVIAFVFEGFISLLSPKRVISLEGPD